MKRKIVSVLTLVVLFASAFLFVSCKKEEEPKPVELVSIEVSYQGSAYAYKLDKLTATYNASNLSISKNDFKFTAKYSNETSVELTEQELENISMTSNIPKNGNTNAGNYELEFSYKEVSSKVNVVVEQKEIDMSNVFWLSYTYDGTQKTLELMNVPTAIKRTQISYSGEYQATEKGTYTAIVSFKISPNYKPIEPMTIEWKIN